VVAAVDAHAHDKEHPKVTVHFWAYQPSHPAYRTAWPTMLADTRRIIDHVRRLGIVIAGPDGRRAPVLDAGEDIQFNGDASTDLAGEPFLLLAPLPEHPRGHPTATASITTNRKPYDLAVTAVLLRAALLVPQAFVVASDASWAQWGNGSPSWPPAARWHSPRRIVADLFDAHPAAVPLHESILAVRFAAPPSVRQFELGQAVHVHAYGNWRPGTVTKLGRTRVTVRYVRNAGGQTDERPFATTLVHPADGVALVAVDQLHRGDVVIGADEQDLTVDKVVAGPRRHRVVIYTNQSRATLSAQTRLRVRT
jgi:hypothetical protein